MSTQFQLIEALERPECYPHPVTRVKRIDTGRSWLLLAGDYAYKIKKPLSTGFLDCSKLAARGFACHEELRLNSRLSPGLYVDVVEFRGSPQEPRIDGEGPTVGYALRMRRFPANAVASHMLARGALTADLLAELGRDIARFHARMRPSQRSRYGTPSSVYRCALHAIEQMERVSRRGAECESLIALGAWIDCEFMLRSRHFQARWESLSVREGHGDLRLDKLALLDGALVPFDCADDAPELRWNDVIGEIAMLIRDLLDSGAPPLAQAFLNAYLEESGDYSGVPLLRFHVVRRALECAAAHLVRSRRAEPGSAREARHLRAFGRCLALATDIARPGPRVLIATHGVTDGLRSAIATELALDLGAITLRYDFEAKRTGPHLSVAPTLARSALHGRRSSHRVYDLLATTAREIIDAGYSVVVDAPCLKRCERVALAHVARAAGVPFVVLSMHPSEAVLRAAWLAELAPAASRITDEKLARVEHDLLDAEPIVPAENLTVVELHGDHGVKARALDRVRAALDAQRLKQAALESAAALCPGPRAENTTGTR
ncbi:MAG: bifunctional aminoglycoside phosphotransferase/ATP-binding protein [Burkholderiales bacterium]